MHYSFGISITNQRKKNENTFASQRNSSRDSMKGVSSSAELEFAFIKRITHSHFMVSFHDTNHSEAALSHLNGKIKSNTVIFPRVEKC